MPDTNRCFRLSDGEVGPVALGVIAAARLNDPVGCDETPLGLGLSLGSRSGVIPSG
jgi:hypothetical protein